MPSLSPCQVSNEAHLFPLHESDLERTRKGRRLRTPLRLSRFNVRIETVAPLRRWRIPLRCIVDVDDRASMDRQDGWRRVDVCISYERFVSHWRTIVSPRNQTSSLFHLGLIVF